MTDKIKFMYYVNGKLDVAEADDSYEFISETVGGMIEHVPLASLGRVDMWCNEEGKLIGLEPTIILMHENKMYDYISGNVVFSRHDGFGETISMTDEDIEFVKEKFLNDGKVLVDDDKSIRFLQVLEY